MTLKEPYVVHVGGLPLRTKHTCKVKQRDYVGVWILALAMPSISWIHEYYI